MAVSMKWKYRKPPEGILKSQLMMCILPQPCYLGDSCHNAHSENELCEWKQRLEFMAQHWLASNKKVLNVELFRKDLIKKLNEEHDKKNVLTELIGGHSILCNENLFIMHVDKDKELSWTFTITKTMDAPGRQLERIFFLNDCQEFSMEYIFYTETDSVKLPEGSKIWENERKDEKFKSFHIYLRFYSKKYGNFCQEVVFDFGGYPKVIRKIGVQVANESTLGQMMAYNPSKYENNELTWLEKYQIVSFDDTQNGENTTGMKNVTYKLPPNIETLVAFDAFKYLDMKLTKQNYRQRLHTLLYVEEYQRRANIQRIAFKLDDFGACVEKSKNDNFTATVIFEEYIMEDLTRLVGRSGKALVRLNEYECDGYVKTDPIVHEVIIISIQFNTLVLELKEKLASLVVHSAIPVNVDVCFCLVDVFQTLHNAVEHINLDLVFPNVKTTSSLPYIDKTETDDLLSKTQLHAVNVILNNTQSAPILLLGPFGAGKTRTLALFVKRLLSKKDKKARVLICTHSNSAADHYIEEYFHPLHSQDDDTQHIMPLRVNWQHRYPNTVSDKVLAYCLQDKETGLFALPKMKDLEKLPLIISTLVTSEVFFKLNLPDGYFTHIVIDEAAQAIEVEGIIPMLLASKDTTIVLAGDHMQMGEPLSSPIAKDLGLGKSLLERLFEFYPFDADCKLKVLENFRSYKEIVELSSHLFYEDSLFSNKIKPESAKFPVQFYCVEGYEVLSKENPTYENVAEATEVMHVINNLVKYWQEQQMDVYLHSICVVSFYPAQVKRIRTILRKNKMNAVRVESVNNIQGLEFNTLIISTVRTRLGTTVYDDQCGKDMGFLTNPKLLNTAITRARYQVIAVGDPVALCAIGECKACWKIILRICNENGTYTGQLKYNELAMVISDVLKHDGKVLDTGRFQEKFDSHENFNMEITRPEFFSTAPVCPSSPFIVTPPFLYSYAPVTPFHYEQPVLIPRPAIFFRPFYCHDGRNGIQQQFFPSPTQRFSSDHYQQLNLMQPDWYTSERNCRRAMIHSEDVDELRQKAQYVREYCWFLMKKMDACADFKEVVRSKIECIAKDFDDMIGKKCQKALYELIEMQMNEIHSFVEERYSRFTRAISVTSALNDTSTEQTLAAISLRVSQLRIFIKHEVNETRFDERIRDDIRHLSYFVKLLNSEVEEVFSHRYNSQNTSMFVNGKLEFLDWQVIVAEKNRDQIEEKINVRAVKIEEEKFLPPVNHPDIPLNHSSLSNFTECEIGACENALASLTIESADPEIACWFSKRRNDPCVQEYVTSFNRQTADRLPSPILDKVQSNVGDSSEKDVNNFVCSKTFSRLSEAPSGSGLPTDYSMRPPYKPCVESTYELESLNDSIYEGVMRYLPSKAIDNIHGIVYTQKNLQVHINGMRKNNRSLPGDKVLVLVSGKTMNCFETHGKVVKIINHSDLVFLCKMIAKDLVRPLKEHGPPILLVRGIGSENRDLDPRKTYEVKIIDWPVQMKYPLGEILNIV